MLRDKVARLVSKLPQVRNEGSGTFRILFLGDFHYGESYTKHGGRILQTRGYRHSTEALRPFIAAADVTIANLETPIVDPDVAESPFEDNKAYVHWASPDGAPQALKELGVSAVSLANNHTLDYGEAGLVSTFQALRDQGISWFGAGRDLEEANAPYVVELPEAIGGGQINLYGTFQNSRKYREQYDFYATSDTPGCAPLYQTRGAKLPQSSADTLHVAFPHWGGNYRWVNDQQRDSADLLLQNGYDLVLGHGAHSLQQIERRSKRWIVYGLGNAVFQSNADWTKHARERGIIPLAFWAMLEISGTARNRRLNVRLYPVNPDNRATDFQPAPIDKASLDGLVDQLAEANATTGRLLNDAMSTGSDELGPFINLDVGEWPAGEAPARLPGVKSL